jgi:peptidoglycan/xylan/chitin deacetylase (PgdA/CDA1 family)
MRIFNCFLVLGWSAALCVAQQDTAKVTVARWPQDRAAAISLTFDDGMNTQLDNAWPILKRHHINGTFFVSMQVDGFEQRKQEWKHLAQDGNELGDHTVKHPCLLPQIEPHSQSYTPEMMESEIRDAAQEIAQLLDWHRGLTFAYPCGNMTFGPPRDQVRNAALYMRFVSEHSFGARGAEGGGPQDPDGLSVLTVGDLGVTAGKSFTGLLALAEPAVREHQWGVYCFHGIGGEWLSVDSATLDELAGYLERHGEIWTATFGDVLRYIQERHAAIIKDARVRGDSIEIALEWPLDAQIYDVPLTLKVELPGNWTEVTATGDGKSLHAKLVAEKQGGTTLVDVPAQTRAVHLSLSR